MGMYAGIVMIFIVVLAVGYYGAKKNTSSKDFLVAGGTAGSVTVAGAILSTVVGGSMTVGSAEMGYSEGMFGIWQSVGSSIAMVLLAVLLCKFFHRVRDKKQITTIPGTLTFFYGEKIGPILGIFGAIGIFLSVLAQIKSFSVLMQSAFGIAVLTSFILTGVFFVIYVFFGGMLGSSLGGIIKMILLYIMLVASLVIVLKNSGGWSGLMDQCATVYEGTGFRSPFSRGVGSSLGYGLSFTFGFMCTQTYVQAVLSAKDPIAARNGCIIGAIFCAPIGIISAIIGMYMHAYHGATVDSSASLPTFMTMAFPVTITGICMGALLLNTLTSGAGLVLGVSSNIFEDVICAFRKKEFSENAHMNGLRLTVVAVAVVGVILAATKGGTYIMTFVAMSATVRAHCAFVPMFAAAYYKGRISREAGLCSAVCGSVAGIVWQLAGQPGGFGTLWFGLIVGLVTFIIANAIYAKNYERNPLLND